MTLIVPFSVVSLRIDVQVVVVGVTRKTLKTLVDRRVCSDYLYYHIHTTIRHAFIVLLHTGMIYYDSMNR